MWSPDPDFILTGSTDFTVRMWSVSKQGISIAPPTTKTSSKGKRTKKKKTKESANSDASSDINSIAKETNDLESVEEELKLSSNHINDDVNKAGKKKKKKATYFPKYAEINKDNDVWCSTVRNLLDVVENGSRNDESNETNCNGIEHSPVQEDNKSKLDKVPLFLGSKKDLEEALDLESNDYFNFMIIVAVTVRLYEKKIVFIFF